MHRNESKVKLEGLGIKNVQDLLRHVAKSKPGARCREQSGALSKGALTSFINKELGPAAWDIYNEALKTGQVEQGGTSPHEWVRSKLPAPPQTDEVVEQLEVSGQARERCVAALRRSNGDANAAAASPLLATSTSSAPTGGAASSSNPFAALCDTDPDDEDSDQEQPRPEASEAEPLPPRPMSTANPVPAAPPLQPPVPAPVLPKPSRSSSPDAPQPPSPSSPRAPTSLFPYDNFKPGYGDKLVWVTHQFASCDNYDFGKASPRSTAGLQDDKYMLAIRELKEKENLVVECWDDPDKNRRLNDVRLQHHVNYFLAHIFESHHVWIGEKKVKELAEQDGQAPAAARKLLKEKTNIEAFDEAKWPDKVHEFLHEYDLQLCDADFKDTQTGAFISSDYLKFGRGEDGKQWLVVRLDLTLDLSKDLAPIFVLFKQRDEPAKPADPQLPVGPCWDLKKFATLSECTGQDHFDDGTKRDIHRYAVIDWADHPPKLAPFRGKKVPWDGRITIEGLDNEHLMSDKESHRRVQKILDEIGIPHDSQQDYLKMKINLTRTLAESQPDLARVQHFREKRTDGTTRSVVQFVLPLYLRSNMASFDLGIVLSSRTRKTHASANDGNPANYKYMTQTVLEPEMVYGNCRLLGSINQQWLLASGVNYLSSLRDSLYSEEELEAMDESRLRNLVRASQISKIDPRFAKLDVPGTGRLSRVRRDEKSGKPYCAFVEPDFSAGYPALPKGRRELYVWLKFDAIPDDQLVDNARVKFDGIQLNKRKDDFEVRNLRLA